MKSPFDGIVKPAQRAKACRIGNLRHRKVCLDNELPGEIEPRVVMKLLGSLPEFVFEQTPQVSRRDAESVGQYIFSVIVKVSLGNELQCALDRGPLTAPGRRTGSRLGTAS